MREKNLFQCGCCNGYIGVEEVGLVDDDRIICNKCKKKVEMEMTVKYRKENKMLLVG